MRVLCATTAASSCSLATGALKSIPAIVRFFFLLAHFTTDVMVVEADQHHARRETIWSYQLIDNDQLKQA